MTVMKIAISMVAVFHYNGIESLPQNINTMKTTFLFNFYQAFKQQRETHKHVNKENLSVNSFSSVNLQFEKRLSGIKA